MRIGICTGTDNLEYLKSLGFDYVEANLSKLANMSDEEFETVCAELDRTQMPIESVNLFCGAETRLSCGIDPDAIKAYAERALARAARVGVETVVIGSCKARKIPEGYTFEEAKESFCRALEVISDVAVGFGIKIAIEPLSDDNFIKTLADGAAICEAVGRENVGCIVDLFHFYKNGEDMADIAKYGKYILHTHIARMNDDRGAPSTEDEGDVRAFFSALEGIGYCGRMSLECSYRPDFETAVKNYVDLLRSMGVM